jgi:AraC-like DNA-binding protein
MTLVPLVMYFNHKGIAKVKIGIAKGRQTQDNLERFRGFGGAQSYPSRTKDYPEVDFSTGSVGLGVAATLFASLVQDYVRAHDRVDRGAPKGRMIALVGDADINAHSLELTCPENDRFLDDYQAFFGGPVKVACSRNRLVFPSEVFDRPVVHRSSTPMPALNDIAAYQLDRFERAYDRVNNLVDKLSDYVRERLGARTVDQKTAARDLAMSPRTLHRKLQENNRSFRDVTDEVRAQKARELLADPDNTIQEVAQALGYKQASSFHRAFKRWTGQTPGQARRELQRS